jgi:NTP pyrophosphatase (non-canonical NTP hydrolase)
MVLAEECGEVSRAVLDRDADALRLELVQVAAVAVAWLEAL